MRNLIGILLILVFLQGCDDDSSDGDFDSGNCQCTIKLNGSVWSKYSVSSCNLCNAPNGYTASCGGC